MYFLKVLLAIFAFWASREGAAASAPSFSHAPRLDFNLDYVTIKKNHKIPTQEIFSNELSIMIAALNRRQELNMIPPNSLTNLKFYLAHIYRSTSNASLKRRLKEGVRLLSAFDKSGFDIKTAIIPENKEPSTEKLGNELCITLAILARKNELQYINRKPLARSYTYLKLLAKNTNKENLKARIREVRSYLRQELERRKILKITHQKAGEEQDNKVRLQKLAEQNLITLPPPTLPNTLPPTTPFNAPLQNQPIPISLEGPFPPSTQKRPPPASDLPPIGF